MRFKVLKRSCLGLFWVQIRQKRKLKYLPPQPLHLSSIPPRNWISLINPQHSHRKGQESEQYLTVPPLVYGITPQESLAGTDQESEKRDSPYLEQTVLRVGSKQDQFPTQTGEVTTPLTQFTQNIMGTSVITVTPKQRPCRLKHPHNKCPSSQNFYLPDGKGSRLSEVHQIKTTERSPEGHPAVS